MILIGIDEVGRGALAGPVMCGAAARWPDVYPLYWPRLRDSKKLSPSQRDSVFAEMQAGGMMWAVAMATADEIDRLGISRATALAGERALRGLVVKYDIKEYEVVVDGNDGWGLGSAVVKADDTIKEVSAASICAKVVRDTWMRAHSAKWPGYGFESNSGYGTRAHMEAIRVRGPSPVHRMSFAPMNAGQSWA